MTNGEAVTAEDRYQMAVLREMGMGPKAIGEAVGRHKNVVARHLKQMGYGRTRPPRIPYTEAQVADWLFRFRDGETVDQICKAEGRSRSAVYEALKKAGADFRPITARWVTCKSGHDLDVYSVPAYSRERPGGRWVQHGRSCRACSYVKRGYPMPTPEKIQELTEQIHARKAAENAALEAPSHTPGDPA